jgi:hypothetical protein
MTWDKTEGMPAYDAASGDLEIGQYAQQANGSFVVHYPAQTYTDATSTVQWPDRITTVNKDPTIAAQDTMGSDAPSATTSSDADTTSSMMMPQRPPRAAPQTATD